ncbi:hypothetical protein INT48_006983 [Thamnidium elegans]|uniref:Uncharacterized protein n=1 Tax=Thamnidium elegans TaxID=101142 RepID=A0A8H7W342_9FUNG|nr:hypothetical protein INT48_006983 [Thamnidium elegans]
MFQQQPSYQFNQTSYFKWYEPPFPYHRRSGRVKFFNMKKGYGFIIPFRSYNSNGLKPEEGIYMDLCSFIYIYSSISIHLLTQYYRTIVFVHRTSILSPNNLFEAALNKGEEVEYELHDGPRGIFALYVTGPKGRPVQLSAYGNN